MASAAFAEGLKIGAQLFKSSMAEVRMQRVEGRLAELEDDSKSLKKDLKHFQSQLKEMRKMQRENLEAKAKCILEGPEKSLRRANEENVDHLISFAVLMKRGSIISGISITGQKEAVDEDDKKEDYAVLLSEFSSESEILSELSCLSNFKTITGVRIDTKPIRSNRHIKQIGSFISSLYKIFEIFGKAPLPLSDQLPEDEDAEATVHVLFSGTFGIGYFDSNPLDASARPKIYRLKHNNVYVLGQNGVGKSTWATILSGKENLFVVGDSVHNTMMPQPCDIDVDTENCESIRLWDLPGLYDGTKYSTNMQKHVTTTVNHNRRYSAVLFIFNGSAQSHEDINRILEYALRIFGPQVKKSFVAIVNDFDGKAKKKSRSYAKALHNCGYNVRKGHSFFVMGKNNNIAEYENIKHILASFPAKFVREHQSVIDQAYVDNQHNYDAVMRAVHKKAMEDMEKFMGSGSHFYILINGKHKAFFNGRETIEYIVVRTHKISFLGRLFYNDDDPEERILKIHSSMQFSNTSAMILNRTFSFEQAAIFRGIFEKNNTVVVESTDPKYDYILADLGKISQEQKKESIERMLSKTVTSDSETESASTSRAQSFS